MLKRTGRVAMLVVLAAPVIGMPYAAAGDDPFEGLPSRSKLLGVRTAATGPSNCVGESLKPEPIGNGEVDGPATTRCDRFVPEISVKAQIWEKRIWGMDRIGNAAFESDDDTSDIAAVAFAECRNNKMRTTGEHKATDVDGLKYIARTTSGNVDLDC